MAVSGGNLAVRSGARRRVRARVLVGLCYWPRQHLAACNF